MCSAHCAAYDIDKYSIRYNLTVLKNDCIKVYQVYPDWVNLRTWFRFLYQNVQQENTENIKAESGHMTEWNAREPEKDSIWRTAIAPWFSSLESSIQQRLNSSFEIVDGQERSKYLWYPIVSCLTGYIFLQWLTILSQSTCVLQFASKFV